MNKYYKAKLKIIKLIKDYKNLYINMDDKYGEKIIKKYPSCNMYSLDDLKILSNNPISFEVNNRLIESPLFGDFNIYNVYSSYYLLSSLFEKGELVEAIKSINYIDGRNNIYQYKDNKIIIDYAHTPKSIESILSYYYSLKPNNIYVIIGFGGNRDRTKRSLMIESILKYTNNIILTEDNSRYEPFIDIIKSSIIYDINDLVIIRNRKEAIEYAIKKLTGNDYLLILGKGNEEYILKNGKYYSHSDKEEVNKWIL